MFFMSKCNLVPDYLPCSPLRACTYTLLGHCHMLCCNTKDIPEPERLMAKHSRCAELFVYKYFLERFWKEKKDL